MASIKMLEAFNKKVIKAIVKLGAVSTNETFIHHYNIQTKAGQLLISLHLPESPSGIYCIFCRFEDVEKAKIVLTPINQDNLNKHSGKWNFHYLSADSCLEIFLSSLNEIL